MANPTHCCIVFSDSLSYNYVDCSVSSADVDMTSLWNTDLSGIPGEESAFLASPMYAARSSELWNYDLRGEYLNGLPGLRWCKPNHYAYSDQAFWSKGNLLAVDAAGGDPTAQIGFDTGGHWSWVDEHAAYEGGLPADDLKTGSPSPALLNPHFHARFTPSQTNIQYHSCSAITSWYSTNYPGVEVWWNTISNYWNVGAWVYTYANGLRTTTPNGSPCFCKLPVATDTTQPQRIFPYSVQVYFTFPHTPAGAWPSGEYGEYCEPRIYFDDDGTGSTYVQFGCGVGATTKIVLSGVEQTGRETLTVQGSTALTAIPYGAMLSARVCVYERFVCVSVSDGTNFNPLFQTNFLRVPSSTLWGIGMGNISVAAGSTFAIQASSVDINVGIEQSDCQYCRDCQPYCPNTLNGNVPWFLTMTTSGISQTTGVTWTAPFFPNCMNGLHYVDWMGAIGGAPGGGTGCYWRKTRCCFGSFEVMVYDAGGGGSPSNYRVQVIAQAETGNLSILGTITWQKDYGTTKPDVAHFMDEEIPYSGTTGTALTMAGTPSCFLSAAIGDPEPDMPDGTLNPEAYKYYCGNCGKGPASWIINVQVTSSTCSGYPAGTQVSFVATTTGSCGGFACASPITIAMSVLNNEITATGIAVPSTPTGSWEGLGVATWTPGGGQTVCGGGMVTVTRNDIPHNCQIVAQVTFTPNG